jgi:UDP-glucose 4-epimerase
MCERIITDFCTANPDFSAVLLRYFNPVGVHKSGLIGEKSSGIPNNLMLYITQTAKGIRSEFSVFGNDYPTKDGTGVRDYIHVVNLAKGHLTAIEYADKNSGVEIFNLSTWQGFSVLEMITNFEQANSVKISYKIALAVVATLPSATPMCQKRKLPCTGRQNMESLICAVMLGTGRKI